MSELGSTSADQVSIQEAHAKNPGAQDMALNAKQKQKKRQQRAAKRKKSGATKRLVSAGRSARSMAKRYARFPVHEALGAGDLANEGIGNLLLSRRGPDGLLGVSFFLVDTYCLGVKNAFFVEVDDDVYLEVKQRILDSQEVTPVVWEPACLRKLVEGAIDYARDIGFSPHKDYGVARELFGEIDVSTCLTSFELGKDGKPFYVAGPKEGPAKSRKIIQKLEEACGAGGYDYIAWLGDGETFAGGDA